MKSERLSFQDEINRNKMKSVMLIACVLVFFIAFGYVISLALDPGYFFSIMILAIILSVTYTIISYYNADKIALASVRAKPADRIKHAALFNAVENMSIASGLPMPRVFIMESEQINAFASGRDPRHAVICVTTGALQKLNKQELEGVVAHEMGHVANFDIRFMTLTAIMVGLVAIAAEMFLRSLWFGGEKRDNGNAGAVLFVIAIFFAILAPIATQLIQFAISRKREFGADASAVKFTRYSPGLRSALIKIKHDSFSQQDVKRYPKAVAPLFISDPFRKKLSALTSTHPPIEDRIRKLEKM